MTDAVALPGASPAWATITQAELHVIVQTLWGEARGEERPGQIGVAWVIRNRVDHPGRDWWGDDIVGVCKSPRQYSCWNADDPNRAHLDAVGVATPGYVGLLNVAFDVMIGALPDPTGGATHYRRVGWPAKWAAGRKPSAVIGRHEFFAIGPGA